MKYLIRGIVTRIYEVVKHFLPLDKIKYPNTSIMHYSFFEEIFYKRFLKNLNMECIKAPKADGRANIGNRYGIYG